jgi:hypothetical protein
MATGEDAFDGDFYIECESPVFWRALRSKAILRQEFIRLFQAGAREVVADGTNLQATFAAESPSREAADGLARVTKLLAVQEHFREAFYADPYKLKVALVDALVTLVAAFGFIGVFSTQTLSPDQLSSGVLGVGLRWGALASAPAILLVVLAFRHSSRGHKLIVVNLVYVVLGFPAAGVSLATDYNKSETGEDAVYLVRQVSTRRSNYPGRSSGLNRIARLDPRDAEKHDLPEEVPISAVTAEDLALPATVEVHVREGRLGGRYVRFVSVPVPEILKERSRYQR